MNPVSVRARVRAYYRLITMVSIVLVRAYNIFIYGAKIGQDTENIDSIYGVV